MNSKIKIYSIILGVIYIVTIAFSLPSFFESFKAGFKEGANEKTRSLRTIHVDIAPKAGLYTFPEKIINTISGQTVPIESDNYKIRMDLNGIQIPTYLVAFELVILIFGFAFLFGIFSLPFIFFFVIKEASRGKIMEPKIIQSIRYLGLIITSFYVLDILSRLLDYLKSTNIVALEKYNVVFNLPDSGLLFLGIVTLLMAEILKVSRKLKEDQDLTI